MVQAGAVYEKCLNVDGRVSTGWRMWKVETAVADDAESTEGKGAEWQKAVSELPF
jgi:hypothetical protein